jgi:hypothetical protein
LEIVHIKRYWDILSVKLSGTGLYEVEKVNIKRKWDLLSGKG